MSALKANDMEAYRVLLAEARGREGGVGGGVADGAGADTDERYASLQEFLEKTEGYLSQLGGKIAALKLDQQRSEAAAAAASVAEENGLSEDEILAAAEAAANAAAAQDAAQHKQAAAALRLQTTALREKHTATQHAETAHL